MTVAALLSYNHGRDTNFVVVANLCRGENYNDTSVPFEISTAVVKNLLEWKEASKGAIGHG